MGGCEDSVCAFWSEVLGQGPAIRLPEVNDDEGVEGFAEGTVQMESGDASTHAKVMPKQDWDALAVRFEVAEPGVEVVEILHGRQTQRLFGRKIGPPWTDKRGERGVAGLAGEPACKQGARGGLIVVADADGAKQG